jgi:hypothetical protein
LFQGVATRHEGSFENPPRSHTKGHEEKEKTFVSLRGGFSLVQGVARDMSDSLEPANSKTGSDEWFRRGGK